VSRKDWSRSRWSRRAAFFADGLEEAAAHAAAEHVFSR